MLIVRVVRAHVKSLEVEGIRMASKILIHQFHKMRAQKEFSQNSIKIEMHLRQIQFQRLIKKGTNVFLCVTQAHQRPAADAHSCVLHNTRSATQYVCFCLYEYERVRQFLPRISIDLFVMGSVECVCMRAATSSVCVRVCTGLWISACAAAIGVMKLGE